MKLIITFGQFISTTVGMKIVKNSKLDYIIENNDVVVTSGHEQLLNLSNQLLAKAKSSGRFERLADKTYITL